MAELRPEAAAANWPELDAEQQRVFTKILYVLVNAVGLLPVRRRDHDRSLSAWSSHEKMNRTLFLSGERGTGKTTVLCSLIEALNSDSTSSNDYIYEGQDLSQAVNLLRERLVWLEPIDLETLPSSTNLLGAVLARIEQAIQRNGNVFDFNENDRSARAFDFNGNSAQAIAKLQRLQSHLALAWDGNVDKRAGGLDPDAYTVEVRRAERYRLSINTNFSNTLDEVAWSCFTGQRCREPLFALPVDDFDLNPKLCIDLLQLLRFISAPRLFTLILGDVRIAELVLNLKFSKDFNDAGANLSLLSVEPEDIKKTVRHVSANALRKLIPPNQRLHLKYMTLQEALCFKPLGFAETPEKPLHTLLKEFDTASMVLFPGIAKQKIKNLTDFFLPRPFAIIAKEIKKAPNDREVDPPGDDTAGGDEQTGDDDSEIACPAGSGSGDVDGTYWGARVFETTPRRLADLWFTFRQMNKRNNKNDAVARWKEFLFSWGNYVKNLISEDPDLSTNDRKALLEGIIPDPDHVWDIRRLPIEVRMLYAPEQNIFVDGRKDTPREYYIRVKRTLGWRLIVKKMDFESGEVGSSGNVRKPSTLINGNTAAAIIMLHDLLALGPDPLEFESPFLDREPSRREIFESFILAIWGEDPENQVPWPAPPCASMWEWDLFVKAVDTMIFSLPSPVVEASLEPLAFAWISCGSALVDGDDPVTWTPGSERSSEQSWSRLRDRVEKIVDLTTNEDKTLAKKKAKGWLDSLALLTMPECGLPGTITLAKRFYFAGNSNVKKKYWGKEYKRIQSKRARRLKKFNKEVKVVDDTLFFEADVARFGTTLAGKLRLKLKSKV